MCVYLRAKFEVCSIILTSFRQGDFIPLPPPQIEPLKSPTRLGLICRTPIFVSYTNPLIDFRFTTFYVMGTLGLNGLKLIFSEEELIHILCKTQEPVLSLFCNFA